MKAPVRVFSCHISGSAATALRIAEGSAVQLARKICCAELAIRAAPSAETTFIPIRRYLPISTTFFSLASINQFNEYVWENFIACPTISLTMGSMFYSNHLHLSLSQPVTLVTVTTP
jgi:hypothetical protein